MWYRFLTFFRRYPRMCFPGISIVTITRTYLPEPECAMATRREVRIFARVLWWRHTFGPHTIYTMPPPPEHPNCRCQVPVVDNKEEQTVKNEREGGEILIECRACKRFVRGPINTTFRCPRCTALLQRGKRAAHTAQRKAHIHQALTEKKQ